MSDSTGGNLRHREPGVEKPREPFWLPSPSLGRTDLLWFEEGRRLDPAGVSSLASPRRHRWVMESLAGDVALPGSFQNPFLLRANPNLPSV